MQMKKQLSPWTEDDIRAHKQLDDLLSKNVKWEGSTAEMVQLYRSLVWFAQLAPRINDSIAEITKVYNPAEDKEKAEAKAKKTPAKKDS